MSELAETIINKRAKIRIWDFLQRQPGKVFDSILIWFKISSILPQLCPNFAPVLPPSSNLLKNIIYRKMVFRRAYLAGNYGGEL
jgi:hypothetical protein